MRFKPCKRAVVIGETKLCVQCMEHLLSGGWKIVAIVSDDKIVTNWAKEQALKSLPSSQMNTICEDDFCLFSIINPNVIPVSFFTTRKVVFAVNYHDSLLPRYAGINSTTWAVINGEREHGITLHMITAGIDEGDIILQEAIPISYDETALSLNLKCSEQLLKIFPGFLKDIERGDIYLTKQNKIARKYYGAKAIPDNYAIINGAKDLKKLYRLVRSLDFGYGYENRVATVKVLIKGNFYLVEGFNLDVLSDEICKDEALLFERVKDVYGHVQNFKITYRDIRGDYRLNSNELQYLEHLKSQERKQYMKICNICEDATLKLFLEQITGYDKTKKKRNLDCNERKINEFYDVKNRERSNYCSNAQDRAKEVKDWSCYEKNVLIPKIKIQSKLAIIYLALARFFNDGSFIFSLYKEDALIPSGLLNLVECRNFISVNREMLCSGFPDLEKYCVSAIEESFVLTKDFGVRYNLELLTDIAVVIGSVVSIDRHKIVIQITRDNLKIKSDFDRKLQIDSIAETLEIIFSKYINADIDSLDLCKINILSNFRYNQMVCEWNKTDSDYPRDKTIHALFEEQAARNPNNIALVCEKTTINYRDLNRKANQLANYLQINYEITPDDVIAICLERSEQMIIAMLGILKVGAAYVPIDPAYPGERINHILKDSGALVVISQGVLILSLEANAKLMEGKNRRNIRYVSIDSDPVQSELQKITNYNLAKTNTSSNLAYVIYTSGTTGNSKGVMIEHCSGECSSNCVRT